MAGEVGTKTNLSPARASLLGLSLATYSEVKPLDISGLFLRQSIILNILKTYVSMFIIKLTFKIPMSKYHELSEILPPVLASRMHPGLSEKVFAPSLINTM